jgi:hypothetical protein
MRRDRGKKFRDFLLFPHAHTQGKNVEREVKRIIRKLGKQFWFSFYLNQFTANGKMRKEEPADLFHFADEESISQLARH